MTVMMIIIDSLIATITFLLLFLMFLKLDMISCVKNPVDNLAPES